MRLTDEVRSLIDLGLEVVTPGSTSAIELVAARESLDGPLKIAVAGRSKAGKSTLVNALIGDQIAPTDAGECTQIVTWFSDGLIYSVHSIVDGQRQQLAFCRDGGALAIDLGELDISKIERIEVEWPTPALRSHTIIDTPGLESINSATSDRALTFLTPEDERVTEADAVLYLMRHVHQSDADFLEAFHDEQVSQAAPLNAIAVLSRADEIGVGRLDAMESARKIALGYQADRKIRRLCATVVPVAGLLAQAGAALREAEFSAFGVLAALPVEVLEPLLWSADRFVSSDTTNALTGEERQFLIEQFGLFGIRLSIHAIRSGAASTANDLSALLIRESGISQLRQVLDRSFTARRDLLIARSVLLKLDALAVADRALAFLATDIERVRSGAHELTEARALNQLRGASGGLSDDDMRELERLLGAEGVDARSRLGLAPESTATELRSRAFQTLENQQHRSESSLAGQEARNYARIAVRTCEGLIASLT